MISLWRAAKVALAWLAFLFVVAVVVISGVGGREGGVLVATVAVGAAGGALAWWAAHGAISLARTRAATLGGACIGLAVGAWAGLGAPPSHGRVARAYDELRVPAGLAFVSTENVGNALCLDDCPTVIRNYRTAQLGPLVADAVRESLRAQGYDVSDGFDDGSGRTVFSAVRGRRSVVAIVDPGVSHTTVRFALGLR